MKYLPITLSLVAAVITGCGKKDEPSVVAEAPQEAPVIEEAAPAEVAPAVEESVPVMDNVEEVVTTKVEEVVESVKDAMPEIEETVASLQEAMPETEEIPEMGSSLTAMKATGDVAPEAVEPTVDTSMVDQAKDAAIAMASSVDWANLSWNDVAAIPYDDKDQLISWATPQIEAMKEKLTKAVMDKGVTGLASLGDTGWQGAIKTAIEALDSVRTSSPETWEMARGSLMTAWQALESEVTKYISGS